MMNKASDEAIWQNAGTYELKMGLRHDGERGESKGNVISFVAFLFPRFNVLYL